MYRFEATSVEGFIQQLAVAYITNGYWFYVAGTIPENKDARVFELRIYHAAPGKLDDLNKRFRDHTAKLFEKYGMENIGYWTPLDNTNNVLIYVLGHASRDAAKKSFAAFGADPEWQAAQKASEANGRLVTRVDSYFMSATDYSPAIKSANAGPRAFELREYTASAGNLGALDARFRDHTVALFSKHGMQNVAYWHVLPPDSERAANSMLNVAEFSVGLPMANPPKRTREEAMAQATKKVESKLIYIIAHKSPAAGAASFDAFRQDPDWVKARADSEKKAGGSLTEGGMAGVKSIYLKATDYSPMK